jgi:hypothetical protein
MTEATSRLSRPADAITLARYLARKAIKAQWRAQGLKVHCIEARDLANATAAYLAEHRAELVAQAQAQLCKISN